MRNTPRKPQRLSLLDALERAARYMGRDLTSDEAALICVAVVRHNEEVERLIEGS